MKYWLDVCNDSTWRQFQEAGGDISGFQRPQRAELVKPGDILLCYMTVAKRWVGLLEVESRLEDDTPIRREGAFPIRFRVKPIVILSPELGVPMDQLEGKLSFYPVSGARWSWAVRASLKEYKEADGRAIEEAILAAKANPVPRPVDASRPRQPVNLDGKSREHHKKEVKTVPADETHTEMQWRLLDLGAKMGHSVWAPRGDRAKCWGSRTVGDVRTLKDNLPSRFTSSVIEAIDVLWLDGHAILAAFEVQQTTSIYSGLLRLSDLLAKEPTIKLYVVAPERRRSKFEAEVARPTFAEQHTPLHCEFLSYEKLRSQLGQTENGVGPLKPEFLDEIADRFDP